MMQSHTAPPEAASAPTHPGLLHAELARAVSSGTLALQYQPRVDLRSRRITGAEALARWPHRRRGMVPPATFIPIAEQSALIVDLGRWVLATACATAARWPGDPVISVNVSARQLAGGTLLSDVRDALDRSALSPGRLELELTESMLIDAGVDTLLTLSAVRDLGIGIALDDFGTGYASLAALKRLPLTVMKLDRSLVRGVARCPDDSAVARAIVSLARAFRLDVVAEGIEDEEQCRFLAELGCREGQSFFLGRPAAPERISALLEL